MKIGREEVLHVASLAALKVPDDELLTLVNQLQSIVDFVAQLGEVPAAEAAAPFVMGPAQVALRADVVHPEPLAHSPAEMAPEFAGGLFTVPRHTAMEEG
jgi:aspartyl/glutamyl-tRNA(Asn/Gln) amidotransferase C subunit